MKKPKKVSITLQDLYRAWNYGKKSSENYIGKPASKSAMVLRMATRLGLLCFLVGCSAGYQVESKESTVTVTPPVTKSVMTYQCRHQRPFFMWDSILKICDTKEECNAFCEKQDSK